MEDAIKWIDKRLLSIKEEKKSLQRDYMNETNFDNLNVIAERNMGLSMLSIELEYIKTLLR